uniref:NADH dehydrogenase subunit 4L n=1 Tax=Oncicola luehei TaxID=1100885 RepID=H2E2D8_9BILA|nr:NADH dehydrogenase subunit 4L [Oncicola luehei]AER42898.1 NADH dehydrogenase subunit 4L [Oncicola luehei]
MVVWWAWVLNSVSLLSWLVFMEIMVLVVLFILGGYGILGVSSGFVFIVLLFVGVISLVCSLSLYVVMVRSVGSDSVGMENIV